MKVWLVGAVGVLLGSWGCITPAVGAEEDGKAPAGPVTMEKVVGVYAAAVRHFEPRVTERDARLVAGAVVDASSEHGLDGRLVVALLVSEGMLGRLDAGKDGPTIAGKPAAASITTACRDVKARMRRFVDGTRPEERVIWLALKERAAQPGGRKGRTYAEARATKTLALYRRLCGEEGSPGAGRVLGPGPAP